MSCLNQGDLMKYIARLILISLWFSSAMAASFDCSKASTWVEKSICADPLLGKLDEALARNYQGMLASVGGHAKKEFKKEQLKWLARRNQCTSTVCLTEIYRKRVDETCDYGVVSGVHPECSMSEDIK
jgi:uncharacterized protein